MKRHDFKLVIRQIEAAGLSLYKIAVLMHRETTQIKRIRETGRCQHYEGEMLLEILREASKRNPLQSGNVQKIVPLLAA